MNEKKNILQDINRRLTTMEEHDLFHLSIPQQQKQQPCLVRQQKQQPCLVRQQQKQQPCGVTTKKQSRKRPLPLQTSDPYFYIPQQQRDYRQQQLVKKKVKCPLQELSLSLPALQAAPAAPTSKYMGIMMRRNKQVIRWAASVGYGGKKQHIGTYDSEDEAAHARDKYILKNIRNYDPSMLNFIPGTHQLNPNRKKTKHTTTLPTLSSLQDLLPPVPIISFGSSKSSSSDMDMDIDIDRMLQQFYSSKGSPCK